MTTRYEIHSPRLRLRPFDSSDFDTLFAIYSDPSVMRFIQNGVRNQVQTLAELECYIRDWDFLGYGQFAVENKESGKLMGICGFVGRSTLGYLYAKEYWGQGFATEAMRACLWFGFDVLKREHMFAGALKENVASLRVLAKVGMNPTPNDYFDSNGGVFLWIPNALFDRAEVPCTLIQTDAILPDRELTIEDKPTIEQTARGR